MCILVAGTCLFLLLVAVPCSAQLRSNLVAANRVGNATIVQQGSAPTRALVRNRSGFLPLTRSYRSVPTISGAPCTSADTSRKTDRLVIGVGLLGIGIGGVGIAVLGGIGTYELFTAGEGMLISLGAALGVLSVVIGTIAVRTIVQGVHILLRLRPFRRALLFSPLSFSCRSRFNATETHTATAAGSDATASNSSS